MDEAWFFGEGEERREPRERRRAEPTRLRRIFRQVKAACTPSRFGFLACSIAGFWLVCAAVVFYNYAQFHNPKPRFSYGNWTVVVYFTCLLNGRFSKGEQRVLLAAGGVGLLAIGHSLFLFWHLTNVWSDVVGEYWRFVLVVIASVSAAALPRVLAWLESKTYWQRLVGRPDLATLMFVPVMAVIATCWLLVFNRVQLFALPTAGAIGAISDFLMVFVFVVVPLGIAMRAKSKWWVVALTQFSLSVLAFVYAFDFSYYGWAVIDIGMWFIADLVMVFLPLYVASRQVTVAATRWSRIFRPLWGVLIAVTLCPILLLTVFDFMALANSSASGSPWDWLTKGSYKKAYLARTLHWGGYFKSSNTNQIVIPVNADSDYLSKLRLGEAGLVGVNLVGLRPEIEVTELKMKSPWIILGESGTSKKFTTRATSNQLNALINDSLFTQIFGSTAVEQQTKAESIQFRRLTLNSLEAGQVAGVLNIAENWNCLPDTGARWQAHGISVVGCNLNDSDWERLSEVSKTVKNIRVAKRSPFPTQFRAPVDAQLIIPVDERTFIEEAKGLMRFSIGTQIGLAFPLVVAPDEVQDPVAMFDQVWATYGLKYNGRGLERLMLPEKVFTENELTDQNFLYDDASGLFVPDASYLKWIDPALLPELKSLSTDAFWLGLNSKRTGRLPGSLEKTDSPIDFMWAAPAGSYTFSKLESLHLSQGAVFSDFKFLQAMPNLQSLQIGNEALENNAPVISLVTEMGKLQKLETLTIVGDSPLVDIKPFLQLLPQVKQLKTIRIVVPTDYPLAPETYETAVQQRIPIEIIHTDDPEFDIPAHFGEHRRQVIERLRKKYGIED
ncbi:MAG: hypothetical protein ABL888_14850 [Pirellulaceae bacterium]